MNLKNELRSFAVARLADRRRGFELKRSKVKQAEARDVRHLAKAARDEVF